MAICVTGHFDSQSSEVEIGEHAVVGAACVVEGELAEYQQTYPESAAQSEWTLNWNGYSYDPAAKVYEVADEPDCITAGVGKTVATLYSICAGQYILQRNISGRRHLFLTLCTSSSVRFLSEFTLLGCRGPESRVRLSPSNLTWIPPMVVSVGRCRTTLPDKKSRFV